MLYPALALRTRALYDAGYVEEATSLISELLTLWRRRFDTYPASAWVTDLAYVLDALGRRRALIGRARSAKTPTRWLEAAGAFAARDYPTAAGLYADIGSLPDEACTRLRLAEVLLETGRHSDAEAAAAQALSFFRSVEATPYVERAETLLASLTRL
jgi:hypothetical protein